VVCDDQNRGMKLLEKSRRQWSETSEKSIPDVLSDCMAATPLPSVVGGIGLNLICSKRSCAFKSSFLTGGPPL
jgi:hypothetical protein